MINSDRKRLIFSSPPPPSKSNATYEQRSYVETSSYGSPTFHSTPSPGWKQSKSPEKQYPPETKMSHCVKCRKSIPVRGIEFDNKYYHPTW